MDGGHISNGDQVISVYVLQWSPYDVTQQAPWLPLLYNNKSNMFRTLLYGPSMASSPTLSIHLCFLPYYGAPEGSCEIHKYIYIYYCVSSKYYFAPSQ